jgi:hypothetical protein
MAMPQIDADRAIDWQMNLEKKECTELKNAPTRNPGF